MNTKEQVYVVINDEETRKKALQVLNKHDQNSEDFKDFKKYPFLKFVSDENIWLTSDYPNNGTTEISVERLDEVLSQGKSEKENGWYKHTEGKYKNWLVYYDFKNNVRYGFNVNGHWFQDNSAIHKASLELAKEKEIENRLIEEAVNRGFKEGVKVDIHGKRKSILKGNLKFVQDYFETGVAISFGNDMIYRSDLGWAEILSDLDSPRPVEKSILQEAEEIINGSRAEDYGSVTENFTKIAVGWKEIFADGNFTPRRVALAMVWLKICRDVNTPKRDNLVDSIGYVACVEKMDNEAN